MHEVRLSVNVDHVATLRQARRAAYPDPVAAARLAESAGAAGITVHLRADRRHIQERDVEQLRHCVGGKLNLEMAASEEMLAVAERLRPHQVTLVPERPDEVTTEGGLDLQRRGEQVGAAARRLHQAGIAVSLFLDPDLQQVERIVELAPGAVAGFEINTDAYTRCAEAEGAAHLAGMAAVAERGHALGLAIYAGHGLTTDNVGPVARLPWMEELNIGHFLVARAVFVGLPAAVREMLAAIGARPTPPAM
jgi:pyridoxine 5-phosphate synthase